MSSQQDPTAAFDTTKRTSAPNKHRGRKITVICGVFVVVVGAAAIWATSADNDKPDTSKPLGDASIGTTGTPSPEKTFDGRYINYSGNFSPNVQVNLKCTNGKPSSSNSWLVTPKERSGTSLELVDIVDVIESTVSKGCAWQFSNPELRTWYKVVVPYEDTKKGYWKIHEQDRSPDSNLHQVTTGNNSQAIVLIYDARMRAGAPVKQFTDISGRYNAPGEGAPDVLKLPQPADNNSASASPTVTP